MTGKRYLIIGDGAAGFTAAQTIRQNDPAAHIRIYSDDPNPAYFRAALTNYLIGELREEQIWAVPPTFYHEWNIERIHARVAAVDSDRSLLYLENGGTAEPYDGLLIAAGSSAIRPAFPGAALPGVMTMRTLQDVRQVMDLVRGRSALRQAVIAGGGPLALEWVQGLHERGVHVTYLLRGSHLMARVLDKTASDLALARLRLAGVEVCLNEEIGETVVGKEGRLAAVRTTTGRTIPCQLAGVGFGVQGNTSFLAGSGLALSPRQTIPVNEQMQTNVGNVYAAGDIAEWGGELRQLWEPARWQGRIAGKNMAGRPTTYQPGAQYNATRLYDLDLASVGEINRRERRGRREEEEKEEEFIDFPREGGGIRYRKVIVRDGRLVGALLLGQRKEQVRRNGRLYKRLIDEGVEVGEIAGRLLDPYFDLNGWLNTATLTAKPQSAAPALDLPSPAEMKKSQFLKNPNPQSPIPNLQSPIPIQQLQIANAPAAPTHTLTSIGLGTQQLARPRLPAGAVKAALEYQGRRHDLAEATVVIGRDTECALVLDDPAVSGHHAQISYHSGDFYLRDLGSRNGTWANGRHVTVPHPLQPGDIIRLGNSDLVFRAEGQATGQIKATAAAPPARTGRLTVQDGSKKSVSLGGRTLIGRDPACHLMLDYPAISGIHLEIVRQADGFYVLSRGRNGTFRRGERLAEALVRLRPGDELTLGQAVTVRFEEG
jgi:nitrite reductase (NADH) large subunit